MKNTIELNGLESNQMKKHIIQSVVDLTHVIDKKLDEFELQLHLLSDSLDMTSTNVIYSRIEQLKAKLSVSSRNIETIQTSIIVSLLKD